MRISVMRRPYSEPNIIRGIHQRWGSGAYYAYEKWHMDKKTAATAWKKGHVQENVLKVWERLV
jgi:hypothetical protein